MEFEVAGQGRWQLDLLDISEGGLCLSLGGGRPVLTPGTRLERVVVNLEGRRIHGSFTVAHLDHDPTNNDPTNLRALCQRCHLTHDAKLHAQHAAITRRQRQIEAGQLTLW